MTRNLARFLGLFMIGSLAVAACTTGARKASDDDDGSAGGFGGSATTTAQGGATTNTTTSGPTTSTTTTATTTTSTVSSTTTGPMGCDTGLGMDFNSPQCIACIQCTQTSDCQSEWSLCTTNTSCGNFITCLDNCDTQCGTDTVCFDNCVGTANETSTCVSTSGCINQNPTGCNDYLTALSCSVCQFCPGDCDAANNCS